LRRLRKSRVWRLAGWWSDTQVEEEEGRREWQEVDG